MTPSFTTVASQHSCFALDRQLLLADLIGGLPWCYDVQTGILFFGDRFAWQAEILGTESEATGTWLWAWANEASNIPVQQQDASLKLKALGEEHGIAELTGSMVPLDHADGHAFGTIAVGERLGTAYYRGPYDGGAAFLLITDERLQFEVQEPLHRIVSVFPQVIAAFNLADHRQAFRAYLQRYDFPAELDADALVVRQQGQEVLRAEFDRLGRLREIEATLSPLSPSVRAQKHIP